MKYGPNERGRLQPWLINKRREWKVHSGRKGKLDECPATATEKSMRRKQICLKLSLITKKEERRGDVRWRSCHRSSIFTSGDVSNDGDPSRPRSSELHPTTDTIAVCERCIQQHWNLIHSAHSSQEYCWYDERLQPLRGVLNVVLSRRKQTRILSEWRKCNNQSPLRLCTPSSLISLSELH